jgi:hypothetical protein
MQSEDMVIVPSGVAVGQARPRRKLAAAGIGLPTVATAGGQWRTLEEGPMAAYQVIVKRLEWIEWLRVVTLSENLVGIDGSSEACGRMYPQLHRAGTAPHRLRWIVLGLVRGHR